ncbi:phosphoribosyltransferase-like protein [Gordonia sp. NPDC003422]
MAADDNFDISPALPKESSMQVMLEKFDTLASEIWSESITRVELDSWLQNFTGRTGTPPLDEQLNALHLLCNYNLFGVREVRELLRCVFRDLLRYPIVQNVRAKNDMTLDYQLIEAEWQTELEATRFLPMGNPSESGAHLLYYFRQINELPKELFVNQHEILDGPVGAQDSKVAISGLKRLVFIDDVLGSGTQASRYSRNFVSQVKKAAEAEGRELEVAYFVLFAKGAGIDVVQATSFDTVKAVHVLQDTELAFDENSHVYIHCLPGVDRQTGENVARTYGELIYPGNPLGYKNGQLLIGFQHNTPNNTLPILWANRKQWNPAFPRFEKE